VVAHDEQEDDLLEGPRDAVDGGDDGEVAEAQPLDADEEEQDVEAGAQEADDGRSPHPLHGEEGLLDRVFDGEEGEREDFFRLKRIKSRMAKVEREQLKTSALTAQSMP
jgi:hypothetical protein